MIYPKPIRDEMVRSLPLPLFSDGYNPCMYLDGIVVWSSSVVDLAIQALL